MTDEYTLADVPFTTISDEPLTQMRAALNSDTIARYAEEYETEPWAMPRIDVFDLVDQELRRVMGDGHTRRAAATQAGLEALPARIHRGTLAEAVRFAAHANATHGTPLTQQDLPTAVRNLQTTNPDLSIQALASMLKRSPRSIGDVLRGFEVQTKADFTEDARPLHYTYWEAIGRAPRKYWQQMVDATFKRGWNRDEIRLAADNLRQNNIPSAHRDRLLAGEDDPLVILGPDTYTYHPASMARQLQRAEEGSVVLLYHAVRLAHVNLRSALASQGLTPADLADLLSAPDRSDALHAKVGLHHDIRQLEEILHHLHPHVLRRSV